MSLNEVSIKIPGEYIPNVFGQFDAFAKKIERSLHWLREATSLQSRT